MDSDSEEGLARARRNRWAAGIFGFAVGLMGCLVAASTFLHRGVTVVVFNADATALSDVVIYTTGHSYPLADIRAGQYARTGVSAKSESHVEIEFRDADGSRKRFTADCYFEGGYSGTIAITLNREKVISTIADVR